MVTFLCTESNLIAGVRYKAEEYYNFPENPNPDRFVEAEKGEVLNPAIALSNMADLLLTDEERQLVLDSRKKKELVLDVTVKMDKLKEIAKERGVEIPAGLKKKEDLLSLLN